MDILQLILIAVLIAGFFGVFQALMPFMGWMLLKTAKKRTVE